MKIQSLKFENFKGIKQQVFDLNGYSSIFFGINGAGKSTVLRAVNILFSRIIQRVAQGRYKQSINIENEDIRFGEAKTNIQLRVSFDKDGDQQNFIYNRGMERKTNRRFHSPQAYDEITSKFEQLYLNDDR